MISDLREYEKVSNDFLRLIIEDEGRVEVYPGDPSVISMAAELLKYREAEAHRKSTQRTHWNGCWHDHHECAVELLEKLISDGNLVCWDED